MRLKKRLDDNVACPVLTTQDAVRLAEEVTFCNLSNATIFLVVYAIFALGGGSLYLANYYYSFFVPNGLSIFSHMLVASPLLMLIFPFSFYIFLVFGILCLVQFWSIKDWIKWQSDLELGLQQQPEAIDVCIMCRGSGRRSSAGAELRNRRFPDRAPQYISLLSQSCEGVQLGHFFEGQVYREPKWLRPVAVQVDGKIVLSRPPLTQTESLLELHKAISSGKHSTRDQ